MSELSQIEKLNNKAFCNYLESIRVNPSSQADAVLEKAQRGEKLRESDIVILHTTDQKTIDSAIMFDEIRDRQASGKLTHSDIDFLVDSLGNVGELDSALRKAFYKKADEINYSYAISHKDEFSEEEILELQQKLGTSTVRDVIKEELEKI